MEEYEYLETLGEGAYGFVWKCTERASGKLVAVKGFKQAHVDPKIMRVVIREIRVLQALQHPAIIPLMDAFQSKSGRVYMVFPYVGRSVFHELREHYPKGIPEPRLTMLVWQMVQALVYMHRRKVVHRDIKPANILLSQEGEVKLCDFGFARATHCGPRDAEQLSSYVVTRWYRAPEVLVGDPYGPSSDIWSLGCTLAELASGQPLFPGKSTGEQLWRIMRCFGPLPDEAGRQPTNPHMANNVPPPARGRSLHERLEGCDPGLFQLLESCLQLDPRRRSTAAELLQSPYFGDVPKLLAGTPLEKIYSGLLWQQEQKIQQQRQQQQGREQTHHNMPETAIRSAGTSAAAASAALGVAPMQQLAAGGGGPHRGAAWLRPRLFTSDGAAKVQLEECSHSSSLEPMWPQYLDGKAASRQPQRWCSGGAEETRCCALQPPTQGQPQQSLLEQQYPTPGAVTSVRGVLRASLTVDSLLIVRRSVEARRTAEAAAGSHQQEAARLGVRQPAAADGTGLPDVHQQTHPMEGCRAASVDIKAGAAPHLPSAGDVSTAAVFHNTATAAAGFIATAPAAAASAIIGVYPTKQSICAAPLPMPTVLQQLPWYSQSDDCVGARFASGGGAPPASRNSTAHPRAGGSGSAITAVSTAQMDVAAPVQSNNGKIPLGVYCGAPSGFGPDAAGWSGIYGHPPCRRQPQQTAEPCMGSCTVLGPPSSAEHCADPPPVRPSATALVSSSLMHQRTPAERSEALTTCNSIAFHECGTDAAQDQAARLAAAGTNSFAAADDDGRANTVCATTTYPHLLYTDQRTDGPAGSCILSSRISREVSYSSTVAARPPSSIGSTELGLSDYDVGLIQPDARQVPLEQQRLGCGPHSTLMAPDNRRATTSSISDSNRSSRSSNRSSSNSRSSRGLNWVSLGASRSGLGGPFNGGAAVEAWVTVEGMPEISTAAMGPPAAQPAALNSGRQQPAAGAADCAKATPAAASASAAAAAAFTLVDGRAVPAPFVLGASSIASGGSSGASRRPPSHQRPRSGGAGGARVLPAGDDGSGAAPTRAPPAITTASGPPSSAGRVCVTCCCRSGPAATATAAAVAAAGPPKLGGLFSSIVPLFRPSGSRSVPGSTPIQQLSRAADAASPRCSSEPPTVAAASPTLPLPSRPAAAFTPSSGPRRRTGPQVHVLSAVPAVANNTFCDGAGLGSPGSLARSDARQAAAAMCRGGFQTAVVVWDAPCGGNNTQSRRYVLARVLQAVKRAFGSVKSKAKGRTTE
ncbi:hypothetical protein PLESTB_000000500 [Pleodorina starrii]|uniref:cyclin-dependent kinase n=1 Tax=Pleodorina starrii TaxID=330485 RepID=A0A9W6B7W0_9CHLO|nr:hypothetical protein PLESTB_000000500 [Pleodorina starrii]GLC76844.1 hypothetical protein PLESTF_001847200 [Pleodorina starrii]